MDSYKKGEVLIGRDNNTDEVVYIGIVYQDGYACLLTYQLSKNGFIHNRRFRITDLTYSYLQKMNNDNTLKIVCNYFNRYSRDGFYYHLIEKEHTDTEFIMFVIDKLKEFDI